MPHSDWRPFEMFCPVCIQARAIALPESTGAVAWYTCPQCRARWSARIRADKPDPASVIIYTYTPTRRNNSLT